MMLWAEWEIQRDQALSREDRRSNRYQGDRAAAEIQVGEFPVSHILANGIRRLPVDAGQARIQVPGSS